jgi:hypothetical protein
MAAIARRDRRDWSQLPHGYEHDAVQAAYRDVKPYFDRRDIAARVAASKATTFEELRQAIDRMQYLDPGAGHTEVEEAKSRLDLILDRVESDKYGEVTIDTEGYTRDQVDRIIAAAKERGLRVSYDGRAVLIRNKIVHVPVREAPGRARGRALHPRLTRVSALPGTRVRVAENDSMYRGLEGTIVTPDPSRVVQLGNHERRLLRKGAVLVERYTGELFVVPVSHLERA